MIEPNFEHKNTKFFFRYLKLNKQWQVARTDSDEITFHELWNLKADAQRFYDSKLEFFKQVVGIE